ncbi:ABC transporter ATP-binding protein [Romboutsia sedimentorum]|uniref:ABC transporter ATP-binding protein n=1 Tax=Romboutsia sedimentorum TaxID=1368474 RepID=A0ABT7E5R7_9FIRM|nr:ABC transporter ATP-binding protein [Romboutsia sedimentorum]MDK2562275.1 ABC transporter ATP-binding protein [Romboutsia sedimentorum]
MRKMFLKYKWLNLFILIFICLTSLAQVLAALSLSSLLNTALSKNLNLLFKSFILVFIMWMLYAAFEIIYGNLQAKCISKMNTDLRNQVTQSIGCMSYEDFNKKDTGNYVSWYTNDINEIENTAFKPVYSIIFKVVNLVFVVTAVTNIHYLITITMIVAAAILITAPKLFTKKISNLSFEQSLNQEVFTKDIKDILSGFSTLKVYNSLDIFNSKANKLSFSLESCRVRLIYLKNNVSFIIGVLNVICQLSCYFIAIYLVTIGKIEIGSILAVSNLSGNCFNSIKSMTSDLVTFSGGKKVFEKLDSLKKYSQEKPLDLLTLDSFEKDITIENLSYNYGDKQVLNNLNMVFEKGKKYALVGPSGCGKSTLLKILIGHINDFSGNVFIGDHAIRDYDLKSIYNNFAYIDQNVYLFNSSVIDNISVYKDDYSRVDLEKALMGSALDDFIDSEKLEYNVGEAGKNLSGGQRQRISIARALLNKKSVILMDEGTSALDKKNSYIIEEKLLKNPDITLVVVSHNINENLIELFDDIYDLENLSKPQIGSS